MGRKPAGTARGGARREMVIRTGAGFTPLAGRRFGGILDTHADQADSHDGHFVSSLASHFQIMNSTAPLTGSHRRTYDTIFQHPASHNLAWHDVHALFRHLGKVVTE